MQNLDMKESCITIETQQKNVENTLNQYQTYCRFFKPSIDTCINKKCANNAFICGNKTCKCRMQHKECLKMNTKDLIENVQKKIVIDQSLETCIQKRIKEFSEYLIKFQEETITHIKSKSMYLGLTQSQKELLLGIKNDEVYTTTGNKIWEILYNNEDYQSIEDTLNFTFKSLNNRFNQAKQQLQKIFNKIPVKIDGCFNKIENCFQIPRFSISQNSNSESLTKFLTSSLGSNIITQVSQVEKLLHFFYPRKIKSVNVIFKASENQFSIQKFHEKCDDFNDTLILLQTQFNKKIGGYTPLNWSIKEKKGYKTDETGNSFLFSLSNGDKFIMKSKGSSIYCYQNYDKGPSFGCGQDLQIYNNSNENLNSHSRINNTYVNEFYQKSQKDSWKLFCGNPDSSNSFKTKEWQVWTLQFE